MFEQKTVKQICIGFKSFSLYAGYIYYYCLQTIYSMAPFPFPQLTDLREKYTYNITPFTAAMSTGQRPTRKGGMNIFSDDDEIDEDDLVDQIGCFTGMFPQQVSPSKNKPLSK